MVRVEAESAIVHSHFNIDTLVNDVAIILLPNGHEINLALGTVIPISRKPVSAGEAGFVASWGFTTDNSNRISENLMVARQVVIENTACFQQFERAVHRNQFCAQDQSVKKELEEPSEESSSSEETVEDPQDEQQDQEQQETEQQETEQNNRGNQPDYIPPIWEWNGFRQLTRSNGLSGVCRGDTGSAIIRKSEKGIVAIGIVSRVASTCDGEHPALYTSLSSFIQWITDATLGAAVISDE